MAKRRKDQPVREFFESLVLVALVISGCSRSGSGPATATPNKQADRREAEGASSRDPVLVPPIVPVPTDLYDLPADAPADGKQASSRDLPVVPPIVPVPTDFDLEPAPVQP